MSDTPSSTQKRIAPFRPSRFAIAFVLFWICLLLVGGAAVYHFREVSNGMWAYNQLKTIDLALRQYHDEHACFPPAVTYGSDGKPWHSWRTLLLPYYSGEATTRGYRFDEPWDSEQNRRFADAHRFYHSPTDRGPDLRTTSYLAVVGDRTMWPLRGTTSYDDALDGIARTVLFVEAHESGILWTEPRDLHLDEMTLDINPKQGVGIRASRGEGAYVVFVGGEVRRVSSGMPAEVIRSMLIRDDGGPTEEQFTLIP